MGGCRRSWRSVYLGALYVPASFAAPLIPLCRRMLERNPELLRGYDFALADRRSNHSAIILICVLLSYFICH